MKRMIMRTLVVAALMTATHSWATPNGNQANQDGLGKYAEVNGLKMYYEIHGAGKPLVLLHGAFGWATTYPTLAKNRQVIAVELQGHGHTADIDRPLTYEQMADDTAALLKQLKIQQADFFGYSMGGNVALAVAIRHPKLVRKLVTVGSHYGKIEDAYDPEMLAQFKSLSPDNFAPKELKDPYDKVAPDPKQWPVLVAKIKKMDLEFKGFAREDMRSIKAHVLVTIGDRDAARPEHAVEMFRLIPNAQLAVFPGADHFLIWTSPEKLLAPVAAFLDAPMPEAKHQKETLSNEEFLNFGTNEHQEILVDRKSKIGNQKSKGRIMQSNTQTAPVSKGRLWAGRIISALPALFLLLDGIMKLVKPAPVVEATVKLGYSENVIIPLGIVLLVCTVLYLIPRTSVLGAILLTGYLGGAVATHVRAGEGLFSIVFPIIFGVLIWLGLYLRDDLLRALVPLRR